MVSDANACRISRSIEDGVKKTSLQFFFCTYMIVELDINVLSFELMAVLHLDLVSALPINILNFAVKLKISH